MPLHAQVPQYAREMESQGLDRERMGRLIRERREQLQLTLEEVGEQVGMTKGGVSHIETARNGTTTDSLDAIARALGARWEFRLVAASDTERTEQEVEVVDHVDAMIDRMNEVDFRAFRQLVDVYYRATRQGQTRT